MTAPIYKTSISVAGAHIDISIRAEHMEGLCEALHRAQSEMAANRVLALTEIEKRKHDAEIARYLRTGKFD